MVTSVGFATVVVVIVKVALVAPAGTVMLAGGVATKGLLLERVTTCPPEDAAAVNVAVPVESAPPTTLVGLSVSEERAVRVVKVRSALIAKFAAASLLFVR